MLYQSFNHPIMLHNTIIQDKRQSLLQKQTARKMGPEMEALDIELSILSGMHITFIWKIRLLEKQDHATSKM